MNPRISVPTILAALPALLLTVGCGTTSAPSHELALRTDDPTPIAIEEEQEHADGDQGSARPEHAGEEHGSGHGRNTITLFLGGSATSHEDRGRTMGLEYEYKITPKWGLGGFAEGIGGDLRDLAAGVTMFYHPIGGLILVAGPGLEYLHNEWDAIFRVGGTYESSLGKGWGIGPVLYYDFAKHDNTFVYGANIGVSL